MSFRQKPGWRTAALLMLCGGVARAASLTVVNLNMLPGDTANLEVSGDISAESTFGVTLQVELLPRAGATGSVVFTPAPPDDITRVGDPFVGGGFTSFDTDQTGSATLNGSVEDNGTFLEAPLTFSGVLTAFPLVASVDAGGVWDVVLSTGAGVSQWEGSTVVTTLVGGTVSVQPSASLTAGDVIMPPGAVTDVIVSGTLNGESTFGVNVLLELAPRVGATGTLTFTPGPPVDVVPRDDPWPGIGTFTGFDTDATGSPVLNGMVDDNGTFVPGPVTFAGDLAAFPIIADAAASGVWDVRLSTSAGDSTWEGLTTARIDGTITVSAGACLVDSECDDGDVCTDDTCVGGVCNNLANNALCDDGDACTVGDVCSAGTCTGSPIGEGGACNDGNLCTLGEICTGGVCGGGAPVDCSGVDSFCGVGVCNPATGACDLSPVNDGLSCDDGDLCTAGDVCSGGLCAGTTIPEGGACDDADPCTQGELCTSGVCSGTAVDCTALDTGCIAGTCNPVTGICEPVVVNNGGSCDDGDACTFGDTCNAGSCLGTPIAEGGACDDGDACTVNEVCNNGVCSGSPVDCSSLDRPCGVGVCDPGSGSCNLNPINEGQPCSDGDVCTENGVCTSGACASTPIDCSGLDDQCIAGTCNPATGICEPVPTNETLSCNDGDICTFGDSCAGGVCAGTPANCTALDSQCTQGVCNPATGICEVQAVNEGSACDDGDRCTAGDQCASGTCVSGPVDCTGLDTVCSVGSCNPSSGLCIAMPQNEGGACNDSLPCTSNDVCDSGQCLGTLAGAPVVDLSWSPPATTVNAGQTVQIDLVATSGTCADQTFSSVEAIIAWDPSILQLVGYTDNGVDHVSSFPNDSNLDGLNAPFGALPGNDGDSLYVAFAGFSEPATATTGGLVLSTLSFTALAGDPNSQLIIPASSGLFTSTRVLGAGSSAGQPISGSLGSAAITVVECATNIDCDDGNVCTTDTCDANRICQFTNNAAPCDDGLFCTATDVCGGGVCGGSGDSCPLRLCNEDLDACVDCLQPIDCDDGNLCTNEICTPLGACQNPPNTAPCDDGNFCTTVDVCSGGVCIGSDGPCGTQLCDEPNDRCVDCFVGTDCDDGNVCTDDICTNGACSHVNNVLPCNDNQFCTAVDVCNGGACVGSGDTCPGFLCDEVTNRCVECIVAADCPPDGNVCTDDRCILGACFYVNNALPCDDGVFCTATDVCVTGTCVGTGDPCPGAMCDEPNSRCAECLNDTHCDDGIPCTIDSCSPQSGSCVQTPVHSVCQDGLFCNGSEICRFGTGCSGGFQPCDNAALCDEVADTCGCADPVAVGEASRYLAVTPAPGQTPVAFIVEGSSVDPDVACVSEYVQADGTLGPIPVFRVPVNWGTVDVSDQEIVPEKVYSVRSDCRDLPTDPPNLSNPVFATTVKWADINEDTFADFIDITLVVRAFQGNFSGVTMQQADLDGCIPNRTIDFGDITSAVNAFQQKPFPCPTPCP